MKQAQPHGLQKWIYWNLNGEPWMTNTTDVNLLVDHEMAHLRRWKALGVEPAYVMLWNEPGSNGPWVTPAYYHDAVVALGRKLSTEGFSTKIVAPGGVNLGVTLN